MSTPHFNFPGVVFSYFLGGDGLERCVVLGVYSSPLPPSRVFVSPWPLPPICRRRERAGVHEFHISGTHLSRLITPLLLTGTCAAPRGLGVALGPVLPVALWNQPLLQLFYFFLSLLCYLIRLFPLLHSMTRRIFFLIKLSEKLLYFLLFLLLFLTAIAS